MKKFICRLIGHKMYRVKPFFNLTTGWVYNFAVEEEKCVRCGRTSTEDLLEKFDISN